MELTYTISQMHCDHCRAAIESHVGRVPGVEEVRVDLVDKHVRVAGRALEDDAIRAAVDAAGFDID